jgi:hypothetical protein
VAAAELFSSAPETYNYHKLSCKVSSFPQISSSRIRISLLTCLSVPSNGVYSMRPGEMIPLAYTAEFKDAKAAIVLETQH